MTKEKQREIKLSKATIAPLSDDLVDYMDKLERVYGSLEWQLENREKVGEGQYKIREKQVLRLLKQTKNSTRGWI